VDGGWDDKQVAEILVRDLGAHAEAVRQDPYSLYATRQHLKALVEAARVSPSTWARFAMSQSRAASQRWPGDASILALYGRSAILAGRIDVAEVALERCVRVDDTSGDAWRQLAEIRQSSGDVSGARAASSKAARLVRQGSATP
jgi:Flp pilus assembly protein TadD